MERHALRDLVGRIPYPWYLIVLWLLVIVKTRMVISPLVTSFYPNLAMTLIFVVILALTIWHNGWSGTSFPRFRLSWTIPLVAGIAVLYVLRFLGSTFGHFGYTLPDGATVIVGLPFVALSAALFWTDQTSRSHTTQFAVLFAAASVLSLIVGIEIVNFPLDVRRSDMLPLIISANQDVLSGINPYHWHADVGPFGLPLTYLPTLWLFYLPPVAAGLDPRLMNIAAHLSLLVTLYLATRSRLTPAWWSFLLWMSLNPLLVLRHDIHMFPLWFGLALTLWCMVRERWSGAAVGWGLIALMRSTTWILIPFYLLYILQTQGWRAAIKNAGITVFVSLSLLLPFLQSDPHAVYYGVIEFYQRVSRALPTAEWTQVAGWTTGFSFVPLLYRLGLVELSRVFQVIGVTLPLVVMIWRRPTLAATLKLMSVALAMFLLFNSLVWEYMYTPLLILLIFVPLASQEPSPPTGARSLGHFRSRRPGSTRGPHHLATLNSYSATSACPPAVQSRRPSSLARRMAARHAVCRSVT